MIAETKKQIRPRNLSISGLASHCPARLSSPDAAESGPATIHAARFDGLRPGTQYSYAVAESGAPSEPSHTGSFRTAPNDDREIVRFTAVISAGNVSSVVPHVSYYCLLAKPWYLRSRRSRCERFWRICR